MLHERGSAQTLNPPLLRSTTDAEAAAAPGTAS